MLKLEANYSTIEKIVLKSTEGFSQFSLSKEDENLKVKLKHGSFPFSLSVKVKVVSTQKTPDDPIILKVGVPSFLMEMLKSRIEREGLEVHGNEIHIYPKKIARFLEDLIVSRLEFEDDRVILHLEEV
ncbi:MULTISPECIES: hypothetical protein [Thermotoga]|jgi:hypothetical protein|uniref:Uncharacterized protein n=3 Tax=Thermotoga petrophila TaxID=93929 RepID=A5ILE3_THEP1|nr:MULTISPECIES: hypothetical protein [Thermotoga]MBZ4661621.1 hypothetical protein [Thermotoga sp.]HAA82402.1 hypothetical protein [Thermotoga petrophila]ABQ47016.1 hypothetical protein Tpet_0998 [Thermotoga petrophila RKU-1]ACB09477.1 conserved hypothetical protein [Thermotoga sp. RQ2]ADA67191.1 conserved hypothetical protein [Thermotoga petrophila RKU-10]